MELEYSVVIPTFRQPRMLMDALESAWAQTLPPAEVIVVIDGDGMTSADAIRTAFPGTDVITHDSNRGQAAARNTGIERASAEWVAFLDHDDLWHQRKQERFADHVALEPDCAAIRCGFWMFTEPDVAVDGAFGLGAELVGAHREDLEAAAQRGSEVNDLSYLDIFGDSLRLMMERNRGTTTGSMIRRELLSDIPRVPDGLSHGEDWLLFTHVAARAEWHLVAERNAFVRLHASQTTRSRNTAAPDDLLLVLDELWRAYGHRPGIELADYGSTYRALAQNWIWDSLRHGDVRTAARTYAGFRRFLPSRSDRAYALTPRPVTWRLDRVRSRRRRASTG